MSEPASRHEKQSSLGKGLLVLREVGRLGRDGGVRLGDVASATRLGKATTHRLLGELRRFGLIEQISPHGNYRLGKLVLALAAEYHACLDLRERALRTLRALVDRTGLTAHLAIRDGDQVVYVEKIETTHNVRIASGIGVRGTLHSTALGKALLAFGTPDLVGVAVQAGLSRRTPRTIVRRSKLLRELVLTRERGYAVDDFENQPEVRCVGAPVFDQNGEAIAAISLSGTTSQLPKRAVVMSGQIVRDHALALSAELGYAISRRSQL